MAIDFTKPVRTKDGKPVRILCTDRTHSEFPIVGLVSHTRNGQEWVESWTTEGHISGTHRDLPDDLENIPEKVIKNIVFYKRGWDNKWHFWGEIPGKTEKDFRDMYPGADPDVKIRVTPIEFDA